MDPSSSISSEFAVDEQGMQEETITYLEGEFYKAALDGSADAFNVYQESHLHCLVTPNQNTVLHLYLAQNYRETSFFQAIYGDFPGTHDAKNWIFTGNFPGVLRFKKGLSIDFVEEILERCPSLLLKPNAKGEIPLHIAARFGHFNIVELLIKYCAKAEGEDLENSIEAKKMLRMTDNEKNTALHKAVRYGHLDVVRALTQNDPDFSYSGNKSGETPLYIAARRGYACLVTMILEKYKSANHDGPCGRTALHAAVMARSGGSTTVILKRRRNLTKIADEKGQTPLHYAAHFGFTLIAKLLLERDESAAYVTDNEKMTALLMAARQGHYQIMREIINHCPGCCEIVDKRGWNFYHYAAVSLSPTNLAKFLRAEGYRRLLDEEDEDGSTPLQVLLASRSIVVHLAEKCEDDRVTLGMESLDSNKKAKIFKLLDEVGSGEVAGVAVRPMRHCKVHLGKGMDKLREAYTVLSGLVATVTFAAVFTVPGGYKSDQSPEGQGTAILSHDSAFKAFVIADAIAMVSSLLAINFNYMYARGILSERGKQLRVNTLVLLIAFVLLSQAALVVAFVTGMYAVLKPSLPLAISNCVIVLSFYIGYLWWFFKSPEREF